MANIANTSRNTILTGTSANDSVYNYARNVTINAGAGADTVQTFGNNVSVFGGAGNDSIRSTGGSNVTLHGGGGNDTLTGSSNSEVFQYRSDGGSDVITNYGENDTLHIAAGSLHSYYADGEDFVVEAKGTSYQGSIRLKNAADREINVKQLNGDVETLNQPYYIANGDGNTLVTGTPTRDFIDLFASNITVNAGAGNDTINNYADGNIYRFGSDGGHDLINGFSGNDTLQITAGALDTYNYVENDLVIGVKGTKYSGVITLAGVGETPVHILNRDGSSRLIVNYDQNVEGSSRADEINIEHDYVTVNALGGNDLITGSVNYVSVNGGAGADTIEGGFYNSTLKGGAGNDLFNYYGSRNVIQFASNEGNDTIQGFQSYDTVQLTAGSLASHYADGEGNYILDVRGTSYAGSLTLAWFDEGFVPSEYIPIAIKNSSGRVSVLNADTYNLNSNTRVNGTNGADRLTNLGDNVSINVGNGNDLVIAYGNNVSVNGGAGNDSIYSRESFATLEGGAGDDFISTWGDNKIYRFSSADGNDLISGFRPNDTLQITAGSLVAHYVDGENYVVSVKGTSYAGSITFEGGAYIPIRVRSTNGSVSLLNYDLINQAFEERLNGTSGNDRIYNEIDRSTLNAGGGNDIVYSSASNSSIAGGNGNDSIGGGYWNSTLKGGEGNDTIDLRGDSSDNVIQFASNEGNDLVKNFGENDTLHITAGSVQDFYSSGNDLVVSVKGTSYSGTITLEDRATSPIQVRASNGTMSTINTFNQIDNYDSEVPINGTSGRDQINNGGWNVTVNAGAGDDVINGNGTNFNSLNGGAGNDIFNGNNYESTFVGGRGNDFFDGWGGANVYCFGAGDGHDTINHIDDNSTLAIDNGSIVSNYYSGEDFIVSVRSGSSSGSIRINELGSNPLRVINADGSSTVVNYNIFNETEGAKVSGTSGADRILNDNERVTINALGGNDFVFNNKWWVTIEGGAGNDTMSGGDYDTYLFSSADGHDVIRGLGLSDTIQLTAGSIASHYQSGDDYVVNVRGKSYSGSLTIENVGTAPVHVVDTKGNASILNYDRSNFSSNARVNGTSSSERIFNGGSHVTLNAGNGNDTIANMKINWSDDVADSLNGGAGDDYIYGLYSYSTIKPGAGNDTILAWVYNGNAIIQFGASDGYDFVQEFDPERVMIQIDNGSITSHYDDDQGNHVVEVGNSARLTLQYAAGQEIKLIDKNNRMTLLNSEDTGATLVSYLNNALVNGTSSAEFIHNEADWVTINALGGNDTICSPDLDFGSIHAGAGNDLVQGNSWSSTFDGGSGNDTIDLNYGYQNVIRFASDGGHDLVTNFGEYDTLHITAGALDTYRFEDGNAIVSLRGTSYRGAITLGSVGDNPIHVRNRDGSSTILASYDLSVEGSSRADTINVEHSYVTVNAGAGNDTILGFGGRVSINGGNGNDSVVGSYWDSTLNGGSGNDTLMSGGGNVIQFGSSSGHDVVTSFGGYDTLQLTVGSLASHYFDDDDYVVSVKGASYSGSITFKDAELSPIRLRDTKGNLSILNYDRSNFSSNTTVNGTSNAERIFNEGSRVTLNAAAGNDTIYNFGAAEVSLNGGNGNDSIIGDYWYSTINGSAGNDTLEFGGYGNTILFASNMGRDVVTSYGEGSTLKITAGSIASHYFDGDDLVVSVKGTSYAGSITFKNAEAPINYVDGNGNSGVLNGESNSELVDSIEDYWFTQEEASLDELDRIMSSENNFVGLEFDPNDQFKAASLEIVDASARSRQKK